MTRTGTPSRPMTTMTVDWTKRREPFFTCSGIRGRKERDTFTKITPFGERVTETVTW